MQHGIGSHRIRAAGLALLLGSYLLTAPAGAATQSALSKWLSKYAIPELRDQLQNHPRYQDQRIAIVAAGSDALSEAVATLLRMNLENRAGISLSQSIAAHPLAQTAVSSIDVLNCSAQADFDYILQVSALPHGSGRDKVSISLLPVNHPPSD